MLLNKVMSDLSWNLYVKDCEMAILRFISIFLISALAGFSISGFVPMIVPKDMLGAFSTFSYISGVVAGISFSGFIWLFYKK